LKDPLNYQGVDPAEVGRRHHLVLGKHSGRHAVRQAYAEILSFDLELDEADRLLPLVRRFATLSKRPPEAPELIRFLAEIGNRPGGPGPAA
jgi:homocitrate synthase NifV